MTDDILIEFIENGYDITKLNTYKDFLTSRRNIAIDGRFFNRHHILPKFMGGSNKKCNIIELLPEDHYNAHLILAECFDIGSRYSTGNYASASKIVAHIRSLLNRFDSLPDRYNMEYFWSVASVKAKELMSGINNPMYGKNRKHTEDTKARISKSLIEMHKIKHPLPSEIRECDIVINGINKKFYRICNCGKFIYYIDRYIAVEQHNKCTKCKECTSRQMSVNSMGREITWSDKFRGPRKKGMFTRNNSDHKNPRAKTIIDLNTNIIYTTMKEAAFVNGVSIDKIRNDVKKGKYKIIGYTNAPAK